MKLKRFISPQIFLSIFNSTLAIHCEWDQWLVGECSETCGTGTRTNTRTKLVVEEHGGTCTGEPYEIEECNTQECPGMNTRPFLAFVLKNINILTLKFEI